jgi:hypothetical protein
MAPKKSAAAAAPVDSSLEGLVGALKQAATELHGLPAAAVAAKGPIPAAAGMRALIDLKRSGRDQHLALGEHKEATNELKGKLARAHLYLQVRGRDAPPVTPPFFTGWVGPVLVSCKRNGGLTLARTD